MLFCMSAGVLSAQETITRYIQDGNDDAWQTYYSYAGVTDTVGDMFVGGEYLSAGYTAWSTNPPHLYHYMGLRYLDIPIPPKAEIISAYIQFTSFSANTKPDKLFIRGVLDPSPAAFSSEPFDISNRHITTGYTPWNVEEWQSFIPGPAQKTPDFKYVVQLLVDQEGYTANKPMAFVIRGAYTLLADTTLPRQACSYEFGGEFYAPILTITYKTLSSDGEDGLSEALSVFPNPVEDAFSISLSGLPASKYSLGLFDMQGRPAYTICEQHFLRGDHRFELSAREMNLSPGLYILSLRSPEGESAKKIVLR